MKRKIKIERVSTWSIVTTIIVAVLFGFISFQSEREFHVLQTTTEQYILCEKAAKQLQDGSDRYDRVVRVLGENAVDDAVQQDIQEQKALEEKRQMEQMPTGSIHDRLAWGARKSSRKAALWQSKNRVLG